MNKLIATQDFESQDGSFKKGDELVVNDERALALTREGKVERAADQTLGVPKAKTDDKPAVQGTTLTGGQLNVPQRQQ